MSSSNRPQQTEFVPSLTGKIGFTLFNPESKSTSLDEVKKILQHTAQCDYNVALVSSFPKELNTDTLYLRKYPEGDVGYRFINEKGKLRKALIEAECLYGDVKELIPYVLKLIQDIYLKNQTYDYNILLVEEFPELIVDDSVYIKDADFVDEIEYRFVNKSDQKLIQGSFDKKKLTDLMSKEEWLAKVFASLKQVERYQAPLAAVAMARKNPALVLEKTTFTEEWCGSRKWEQPLSALQYAAWAGDTPMVDEFLAILPVNLQEKALEQLIKVRDRKLQRPHLSAIGILLKEYKKQGFDRDHGEGTWMSLWKKIRWQDIREKQFKSVVNLIQQFCSSTPFSPIPEFKVFPETRSLIARKLCPDSLTNSAWSAQRRYRTEPQAIWTSHHVDLSSLASFGSGLTKGYREVSTNSEVPLLTYAKVDYDALEHYYRLRKQELNEQIRMLQTNLENQLASPRPH